MRRDVRPYWVKRLYLKFRHFGWWFGAAMRIIGGLLSHYVALVRHHIESQYPHRAFLYGHWEMHHPVQIGVWGRNFGEGVSRLAMLANESGRENLR